VSSAAALAPWLTAPLQQALHMQQHGAHALLLSSLPGLGAFALGQAVAKAALCEAAAAGEPACGQCTACHLFDQRSHPDLYFLLPAALRVQLGWQEPEAEGKAKPSQEIRIDEVRAFLNFAQATRARSRGKVVLVHPAEAMNTVAANALLKTLEEPSASLSFVLVTESPDLLLPTIRSRCQALSLPLPSLEQGTQWLKAQQAELREDDAQMLLRAAGLRPQQALDWLRGGLSAPVLAGFARAVARADLSDFSAWRPAPVIDLLQRLAHDLLRVCSGAAPQYFSLDQLPKAKQAKPLHEWLSLLQAAKAKADHPLQLALWLEALAAQGQAALRAACKAGP